MTPNEALAAALHAERFVMGRHDKADPLPCRGAIDLCPPDKHVEKAERLLGTLSQSGWSLVRTEADPRELTLHPGQHEFTTVCRLCGDPGMLHVSVITPHERVSITDPRADPPQDFGEQVVKRGWLPKSLRDPDRQAEVHPDQGPPVESTP